jgi:ribosomal protein L16 Arg81 hydroxylase
MKFIDLLFPNDSPAFMANYWNRAPLYIKGDKAKLITLPSLNSLPSLIAGSIDFSRWVDRGNTHCNAYKVNLDGSQDRLNDVPFSMFSQLYNAGYTLCFGDVSQSDPMLLSLVESTKDLTEFKSDALITSYLSPPQSSGIVHYDCQHVFFLQRSGSKCWRVSEQPGKQHPLSNFMYAQTDIKSLNLMAESGYVIKPPSNCGMVDIQLYEGDILYLPPGFYHVPHTKNEHSFHYTLTMHPLSFWSFMSETLENILWRNTNNLYGDLRNLDEAELVAALHERLIFVKKEIESLTAIDLINRLKK